MIKRIKPNNYYKHLFSFISLLSIILTFITLHFKISYNLFIYLTYYFILLLILVTVIELFNKGEYLSPLETYDLCEFVEKLIDDIKIGSKKPLKFINKYNPSYKKLQEIITKKEKLLLSNIKKSGDVYEITLLRENKVILYFLSSYLGFHSVYKLHIKKEKNRNFKILLFE